MNRPNQFYFRDMAVLKVMFGAIITAMVLIFSATAIGLLDYRLIWVNPTYLLPGIVGGLIMGVGFILGGFCPGTSLVALATLKIDGVFFVLGTHDIRVDADRPVHLSTGGDRGDGLRRDPRFLHHVANRLTRFIPPGVRPLLSPSRLRAVDLVRHLSYA